MCDEDHEDMQHDRVFVCKASEGVPRKWLPEGWPQLVGGLGKEALARLVVEEPAGAGPVHDHVTLGYVGPDGMGREHPPELAEGDVALTDRSCADPRWASLARAGWGYADFGPRGEFKGGGYGAAPQTGMQSAPGGEHYAVLALCEEAAEQERKCPPIYSDCALVVNVAQKGRDAAEAANAIYAGWWREIAKVNGQDDVTRQGAIGNNKADELARKGTALHAADSCYGKAREAAWRAYKALARTVVEALNLWPPPKTLNGEPLKRVAGIAYRTGTP
jgi:hypothetical protein